MKFLLLILTLSPFCLMADSWDFGYQQDYIDEQIKQIEGDLLSDKQLNNYLNKNFPKSFHEKDPFFRPTALDRYFQLQKNSTIQAITPSSN